MAAAVAARVENRLVTYVPGVAATPYMLHAPLSGDESQVTRRCDYVCVIWS